MKISERKRLLAAEGATFKSAKGSHIKVYLNGKMSILPMHNKDLGPLAAAIKKQLGLQ